jgi:hypothetical protein
MIRHGYPAHCGGHSRMLECFVSWCTALTTLQRTDHFFAITRL